MENVCICFEIIFEVFSGAISPKVNGTSFFTDNVLSTSINGKSMKYVQMRDDVHG